jgi:transposase-like protein
MAYKIIDSGLKLHVVKNFWLSNNVSKTADKYGVSRNAVYDWTKLAEQAIQKAFQKTTPGRRTISLEEENKHLRSQIQELLNIYHELSQDRSSESIIEPMIAECPTCHSSEVCKNGKVYTKRDGLRQRFLCRRCLFSVYVEIKKKP